MDSENTDVRDDSGWLLGIVYYCPAFDVWDARRIVALPSDVGRCLSYNDVTSQHPTEDLAIAALRGLVTTS